MPQFYPYIPQKIESQIIIVKPTLDIRSIDMAAGYLGALIDGEGHIIFQRVGITNTDRDIISMAEHCLNMLQITFHVQISIPAGHRKDGGAYKTRYDIIITGKENFKKIRRLVPISCQRKLEQLDVNIRSFKSKFTKEQLEQHYLKEQLSIVQMAKILGCSRRKIMRWLAKYNIPMRDIKEATALAFEQGRGKKEKGHIHGVG